jgi:antitoxin component of RelBE/YafQ-DinJ toxin-antitoxin module
MGATATLNVRLPESLKAHGAQVLEREGVGVSDAVRSLYEYMEREQAVPSFVKHAEEDKYARRRELLKSFAGSVDGGWLPEDWTMNDVRDARLARLIGGEFE